MSDLPTSQARLDAEECAARQDIFRTLAALKSTAVGTTRQAGKDAVDTAASHPFLTLTTAALAGFAAASTVVPSKKEQLLAKFAAIERALNGRPERTAGPKPSFKSTVAKTAFKMLKPSLMNLVTVALAAKGIGVPPPPAETNGQPAESHN